MVDGCSRRGAGLTGESILGVRVDRKALAEHRDVEESTELRVRAYDRKAATGSAHATRRSMEHGEKLRVGRVSLAEIDDEPRMAQAQSQLDTAIHSRCRTPVRTENDDGVLRRRSLFANLDHRR